MAQGQKVEDALKFTTNTTEGIMVKAFGDDWFDTNETQQFLGVLEKASHSDEAHRLHGHLETVHNNVE